jgi:hypothetical protein
MRDEVERVFAGRAGSVKGRCVARGRVTTRFGTECHANVSQAVQLTRRVFFVQEPLWVAKLLISEAVAKKIDSLHHLVLDQVRDAVVCVEGLSYTWDVDAARGRRALVEVTIGSRRVLVVLYPVDDPMGDVFALGSAYERR